MRGVVLPAAPSRIKGPHVLLRRTRRLYFAAIRFSQHRARTADEQAFAARVCDGLAATLARVDEAFPRDEAQPARASARQPSSPIGDDLQS